MEELTSSLQALSTRDAKNKSTEPAKDLGSGLDYSTAPRPSLEQLPVELQQLIMSQAPTLSSLSALVHASPQLHRVYVEDREAVLRPFLAQFLRGMLVDAVGAYQSGTGYFQATRDEHSLWAFVEEQEAKHTAAANELTVELCANDIIQILHFHIFIIEPLTERYASWALATLPFPSTNGQTGQQPLSNTERCRIQRAMYRLQIFCNVCGSLGEGRSSPIRIEENIDRLRVLSLFPAWEIEEILCFHRFAEDIYGKVFRQVAWDLNEYKNPRYRHLDMTDTNEDLILIWNDEIEDGYINERSLNAVLRSGLQLLSDTLKMKDHEQLVDMMRTAIVSGMGDHGGSYGNDWIDDAVQDDIQMERRDGWYSHRASAQDWRQKMPFQGDSLDSPPLAWVLFWQGEYSNLIGNCIPEALRRWGYVMWDAARLNSRAEAQIKYEWDQSYDESDPREEDYHPSVTDG